MVSPPLSVIANLKRGGWFLVRADRGECVHSITGREGTRPCAGCCKFDKISLEQMPCVFALLRSLFFQSF